MALEERDAEFDTELDLIGEGIQDLAEIAQRQGEEVKLQGAMLDQVNNKMDKVNLWRNSVWSQTTSFLGARFPLRTCR